MNLRPQSGDTVGGWPSEAVGGRTPMTMRLDHDGDTAVLVVSGEIDMTTTPPLTATLRRCLAERPRMLLLDLTEVTFFASAGLHALAATDGQAYDATVRDTTKRDTTVRIAASRAVLRVLELTGLLPILQVYPTRADAMAGTARHQPDDDGD
jgi:anti-sigma B factor antagonist